MDRRLFLAGLGASSLAAYQTKTKPPVKKEAPKTESLMSRILRLTGISATPRGLRGPGKSVTGDVWRMSSDGKNKTQDKLTLDGGYRCPVFTPDDQKLLAIHGQDLVWISMKGSPTTKADHTLRDLVRLVGFETRAANKPRVVVVTRLAVGLFSPWDGTFDPLDLSKEDEEYARGPLIEGALEFHGTLASVDTTGHELTLERTGHGPVALTRGSKAFYFDPALSHDGVIVVFIRVEAKR